MKSHYKKGAEMGKYSSAKEVHIRQNIVLPENLHKLAKEISFREKTQLTMFVRYALESFLDGGNVVSPVVEDGEDKVVEIHTCINLPAKLTQKMKSVAHYQDVMLKDIVKLALLAHLDEFSEKYPDIVPTNKTNNLK